MTLPTAILELPWFDDHAVCPKCSYDDIGAAFQPHAHCRDDMSRPWCPVKASVRKPECCESASEHIHRHCRRCHFECGGTLQHAAFGGV